MPVLWLIIVGAAAGFFATRIMKLETDVVTTVVIGMVGALVGGLVLRLVLAMLGIAAGLIGAVLGAVLLIWVWKTYFNKGD